MILKFMKLFEIINTDFKLSNNFFKDNLININIDIKPITITIGLLDKFLYEISNMNDDYSSKILFSIISDGGSIISDGGFIYNTHYIDYIKDEKSTNYYIKLHNDLLFHPLNDKSKLCYDIILSISRNNEFTYIKINNFFYYVPIINVNYQSILDIENKNIIVTINQINLKINSMKQYSENQLLLFYFEKYYLHILNQLNYLLYDGAVFRK